MSGLDKETRLETARRERLGELADPPPLEPPFPFRVVPFDWEYFGLNRPDEGL